MTTFKAFLKVLYKNLPTVIISTAMLLIFGSVNIGADYGAGEFVDDRPDVTIINRDGDNKIATGLIDYFKGQANLIELSDSEETLKDALFYRETNLIIYIPEHYGANYLANLQPEIAYQSSGDYQAALAEMLLSQYLKTMALYHTEIEDAAKLVAATQSALDSKIAVTLTSKLDLATTSRAARFFNFESYALLNSLVFVIAMIMTVFNEPKVHRRLLVSSTSPSHQNRILLLANLLFAGVMWLLYLVLGFIILGTDALWGVQGLWFVLNSFVFMLCATAIAFLVGTLIHNKNAINGVVNVIALGSSFLCGAFVPQMWLPDSVLAIAHVLPTYYYIDANNLIADLEVVSGADLQRLLFNLGVVLAFTILFVLLAILIPRWRQKHTKD